MSFKFCIIKYFAFLILSQCCINISYYSQCNITPITSLIPNHSFENYTTCPSNASQLHRATGWVAGSDGSSDFYNCSFLNMNLFSAPPSPPEGIGYAGFYNGAASSNEYLATCLPSSLVAGTSYSIQFSLFASTATSGSFVIPSNVSTEIGIFGATNCSSIPFTGNACPTSDWTSLKDSVVTTSLSGWTTHIITFTPSTNMSALLIGPGCTITPAGGSFDYYYIDNIILNTTASFGAPIANAGPDDTTTCTSPSVNLTGAASGDSPFYNYSWSPGGVNTSVISVNPISTTNYILTVTGSNGCTDTDVVTIYVDKTHPIANAGPDMTTNCINTSASLNGSGGSSYSWDNGAGTSSSTVVNPTNTTSYILTVIGSNGCTDTDTTIVTVDKTTPVANAGVDITTSCNSPIANLNGSGGVSYS